VLGQAGTGEATTEFVAADPVESIALDPCEALGINEEASSRAIVVEDPSWDTWPDGKGAGVDSRGTGTGTELDLPQDLGVPRSEEGKVESTLGLPLLKSEVGGIAANRGRYSSCSAPGTPCACTTSNLWK
jgi:hypothetical protein